MKSFFLLVLSACACLVSARADVPAPRPNVITVTNLAAFPKYKFSYRTERRQEAKPIPNGEPFSVRDSVQLLIQSGNDPAQQWDEIKYEWKGATIAIKVESVKQEKGTITVTYKTSGGDSAPNRKSTAALPQSLPLFALTGLGVCGLVLLARRRRA